MTRSNVEMPNEVQAWVSEGRYKEGFFTQLATDELAKGINEEVVRAISAKRSEPEWMLEFRLEAYRARLQMEEPHWLKANYDRLNYGTTVTIRRRPAAAATMPAVRNPAPSSNRARRRKRLPDQRSGAGVQSARRAGARGQ